MKHSSSNDIPCDKTLEGNILYIFNKCFDRTYYHNNRLFFVRVHNIIQYNLNIMQCIIHNIEKSLLHVIICIVITRRGKGSFNFTFTNYQTFPINIQTRPGPHMLTGSPLCILAVHLVLSHVQSCLRHYYRDSLDEIT